VIKCNRRKVNEVKLKLRWNERWSEKLDKRMRSYERK
jgi:hypothetical protein